MNQTPFNEAPLNAPVPVEASAPAMPVTKTVEERKQLLAAQVAREIATNGGRVESQSDFMAVMVYGKRVNHLLHFFIGIFTLGVWWIAWIIMAIFGGESRKVVQVDEFGNVLVQKAR